MNILCCGTYHSKKLKGIDKMGMSLATYEYASALYEYERLRDRCDSFYKEVIFADETVALLAEDGLMYVFMPEDIEYHLDAFHPIKVTRYKKCWYFNETRDRECAYELYGLIFVNPAIVSKYFGMPV